MKLADWFKTSGLKRIELATALGCSPATVTNLLEGTQRWVSKGLAEAISRVTDGSVSAFDFQATQNDTSMSLGEGAADAGET